MKKALGLWAAVAGLSLAACGLGEAQPQDPSTSTEQAVSGNANGGGNAVGKTGFCQVEKASAVGDAVETGQCAVDNPAVAVCQLGASAQCVKGKKAASATVANCHDTVDATACSL